MADVVGIICEYNPFHKGHQYQIQQIKREIPNAAIVAIMSGNIVQRGGFAMLDKYERAKIALECGVNAVFEMPYPYCGSTAEIFARAGVEIAEGLGCDYLYFGTECGDIERLEKIACAIDSPLLEERLREELENKENGYIVAKKRALESMGVELPRSSNDMLAIEYIRAIKNGQYSLKYRSVKRVGAEYNDTHVCDIMSATAIRKAFGENGEILSVPEHTVGRYRALAANGEMLDNRKEKQLLHSHAIMYGDTIKNAFDSSKEVGALIAKKAKEAKNSIAFLDSLTSKVYTASRLKRVLMYSLFDITEIEKNVAFTLLLGIDSKGQQLLNEIKKRKKLCVITKHSDSRNLDKKAKEMLETVYRVDMVHRLLLTSQGVPSEAYKNKPIIKN